MAYNIEFRTKALLTLQRYKYNKFKVCKELGIRYETITSWLNSDFGQNLLKSKVPERKSQIKKYLRDQAQRVLEVELSTDDNKITQEKETKEAKETKEEKIERRVNSSIKDFQSKEAQLDFMVFESKIAILNRIIEIVPKLNNANALATLLEAVKEFDPSKNQEQTTTNTFQQFINEQIVLTNEKSNNGNTFNGQVAEITGGV